MQGTLGREQVNTQGTLTREHESTQDTLAREHVFSTQSTQFSRLCESHTFTFFSMSIVSKMDRFLSLNVVLYIFVFVYYGFYEITLFFIICISSKWEKQ